MKSQLRFSCPCCGLWVAQSRLNEDHLPFKVSEFHVGNRRKGKRGGFVWQKNLNLGGAKEVFLRRLANRLRNLADRLEMEALVYGRMSLGVSALETSAFTPLLMTNETKSGLSSTRTAPVEVPVLMRSKMW